MRRIKGWIAFSLTALAFGVGVQAQQGVRVPLNPQRAEAVRQNILTTLRKQLVLAKIEREKASKDEKARKIADMRVTNLQQILSKYEARQPRSH